MSYEITLRGSEFPIIDAIEGTREIPCKPESIRLMYFPANQFRPLRTMVRVAGARVRKDGTISTARAERGYFDGAQDAKIPEWLRTLVVEHLPPDWSENDLLEPSTPKPSK